MSTSNVCGSAYAKSPLIFSVSIISLFTGKKCELFLVKASPPPPSREVSFRIAAAFRRLEVMIPDVMNISFKLRFYRFARLYRPRPRRSSFLNARTKKGTSLSILLLLFILIFLLPPTCSPEAQRVVGLFLKDKSVFLSVDVVGFRSLNCRFSCSIGKEPTCW